MAIRRVTYVSTVISASKALIISCMLVLYIAGTSGFERLHELLHEHKSSVSHSRQEEQDPCHRAIYHGDTDNRCSHDAHVVTHESCSLCDVIFQTEHIQLATTVSLLADFITAYFNTTSDEVPVVVSFDLPSRAPPVV